ncbi:hypothetical protein PGT21_021312 [Puccinia graminis f. sp. tritici]|uniref:CCAAT-binding factor domain-containing protein n=1 Tax=Puccinia graminis f. sp. tritici TaxID=56615 RepID=A0A5B0QUP0_PUCGR|nr:hypothetical protein PGT21_021312 [Puccinia graminis f. sp. tritici]
MPTREEELNQFWMGKPKETTHQKAFSNFWIAFVSRQDLAKSDIKRILNLLHDQVIPHMIDPKILMDFLVDCLGYGSSISVLSLNTLFTLISKHNLYVLVIPLTLLASN